MVGRGLVAFPLFGAVLIYLANPRWMTWASFESPLWLRWAGVVVGLLTVPAAYWVFNSLGRQVSETVFTKEHHQLVTAGPYRWIRHPLYTTAIVLFLAVGLIAANWVILSFAILALAGIRLVVIPLEERELLAKFGEQYRAYMQSTGALVPRAPEWR
jgi:protein-S-isoprenylcysteine O-methyltransferase Ste14